MSMHLPARFPHSASIRLVATLVVCAWLSGAGLGAEDAPSDNPFQRAGIVSNPAASSGDADLDALQFSGLSSIGDQRSFNFTDQRTHKSFWVPMGGAENGVSIVSYDEQNEQVTVRRGRVQKPLSLRKAVLVAATSGSAMPPRAGPSFTVANNPPPHPPGSGVDEIKNPKTPAEVKQAEYEARMLVSDLLDISMKAREEQRKLREARERGQGTRAGP